MSSTFDYEELVLLLTAGISQRRMYFDNHPSVRANAAKFISRLGELLAETGEESFFLGVADDHFVHDGYFLVGPSLVGHNLIDLAMKLGSGGFIFPPRTTEHEVRRFFRFAAEFNDDSLSLSEARARFTAADLHQIELASPYGENDPSAPGSDNGPDTRAMDKLMPVYQALFGTVESAYTSVVHSSSINIDNARNVAERLLQATNGKFMDIMRLTNYPSYDSYTVGHSVRVSLLLVQVGEKLRMDQDFLRELATAGLLHDLGKAMVADEIIFKPGRLTADERHHMEQHAALGAQLLMENEVASPLAVNAAWGHHLRPDGRGYPEVDDWFETSRATNMLHVCDVFEALTAIRPYKAAMTPRRAYEIMFDDTGAFDPAALSLFMSCMGLFPPGSNVRLSTGDEGVVVEAGTEIDRPLIRLTRNPDGFEIQPDSQQLLDLASDEMRGTEVTTLLPPDKNPPMEKAVSSIEQEAAVTTPK